MSPNPPNLLALLKEALAELEDMETRPSCGNCEAAVPLPHSLECRMRSAIREAQGPKEPWFRRRREDADDVAHEEDAPGFDPGSYLDLEGE